MKPENSEYLDFFNLNDEPFNPTPSTRFFKLTRIHSAAYKKTKYVVDARKGLATVVGDTGVGKSSLLRLLQEKFKEGGYLSVLLTNPSFSTPNYLLRTILDEFEVPTRPSFKDNMDNFKNFLFTNAIEFNKTIVLMIDEAQVLKPGHFELLRQLMNFETNDAKLINIVLVGQDELRDKLSSPKNRNFKSRIVMASTLDKVDVTELQEVISFRWNVASGSFAHPFTSDAVEMLFEKSEGIPREALILADNALLAAAIQKSKVIDERFIEYVYHERFDNTNKLPKPIKKTKKSISSPAIEQSNTTFEQ